MTQTNRPFEKVPKWLRLLGRAAQCLALFLLALVLIYAYTPSALGNALLVFLVGAAFIVVPVRIFALANKNLRLPSRLLDAVEIIPRVSFYGLAALICYLGLVPAQLPTDMRGMITLMPPMLAIMFSLISLFPRKNANHPYTFFTAAMSLIFAGLILFGLREPKEGVVVTEFPFAEEAIVVHGGPSLLTNYHYIHSSQTHALDMGRTRPEGNIGKGDPLSDDPCFGSDLVAVADGRIAAAIDGLPDQEIGSRDSSNPAGNYVVLEIAPERYALYAHIKNGTVAVAKNDNVEAGDKIGECGNSGNTSNPHLHFQVQSKIDLFDPDNQTFPVSFSNIERRRWGRWSSEEAMFLRRNDLARRAKKAP